MKKRLLSLLCVLALCLGLLPITALAAENAPGTLYVGGTQIYQSGYWTSSDNGTTWDLQSNGQPADNYIHYDSDSATLTLKNATIKGNSNNSASSGAGIYAVSSAGSDVALTIELEGTSTVSGVYGIYVQAKQDSGFEGKSASLTISGEGTLTATGDSNHGIAVFGYNGGAALTIENATVTASTSGDNAAGVSVYSGSQASNSPEISLTVNGGSLTANSGTSSDGILFYVGSPSATNPTTSLTVSGNAIVDAKTGGIRATDPNTSDISDQIKVSSSGDGNNGGIVWNGKDGTVYGEVTLQDELSIESGETLNIPEGSSLDCNNNLTNNGTILLESGGTLSGGTTLTTPTITTHPQAQEVTEGQGATFTVEASAGSETPTYQWQQKTAASGSDWTDISQETSTSYTISSTTTSMSGNQYRCVVKSASGVSVTSAAATLTVEAYIPPTTYTISADVTPMGAGTVTVNGNDTSATVTAGSEVTLTATANEGWRFVGWMENGQQVSSEATYTFTANSARSLTAQFDRISSGGGDSDPTYSITLPSRVTGGELKLSQRYAEKGETVTITAIPDEGYELDTLTVTDSKGKEIELTHKGGNEYTFKMPAGRVEIEVSFREIAVELPFTDVPEGAWYEDAAIYVYEHGLMAGTSATTFAPDATTSRSMIATILWRMAGSPVVNYAMDYTDVAQGQWYSEAIRWAASEGIVGGYGNGLFGTNDPITREQFAAMLYRYAQEQGYDVSIGENTNILSYTDVADLSEYAISAMQWAVGAGIINGTGDGSTLTPQGQATRAQAAVMLQRFCEKYAY